MDHCLPVKIINFQNSETTILSSAILGDKHSLKLLGLRQKPSIWGLNFLKLLYIVLGSFKSLISTAQQFSSKVRIMESFGANSTRILNL